jgi:hypothetical protein
MVSEQELPRKTPQGHEKCSLWGLRAAPSKVQKFREVSREVLAVVLTEFSEFSEAARGGKRADAHATCMDIQGIYLLHYIHVFHCQLKVIFMSEVERFFFLRPAPLLSRIRQGACNAWAFHNISI